MRVFIALLLLAGILAAECPPVSLRRDEGLDASCHLFRRTTRNGQLYLERLNREHIATATEAVDCTKAIVEEGCLEYHAHIITARVYCGPAPNHGRKKK